VRVEYIWIADAADGLGQAVPRVPAGPPAIDVEEPALAPKRAPKRPVAGIKADPDGR
jgi:hypothetical protein